MFSINGKLFRTLSKAGDFFILEFLSILVIFILYSFISLSFVTVKILASPVLISSGSATFIGSLVDAIS